MNRLRIVLAGLSFAALAVSFDARAQDASGVAAARAGLIAQAVQARDAGDHAHALELAQRAGEIQMTFSLRRFIAEELAALGHDVDALGAAELCVQEATNTDRPNAAEHRAACQTLVDTLQHRVARIVVHVPGGASNTTVMVGGGALPSALWDLPYAVAPGRVHIEAHGPSGAAFSRDLDLAAGSVTNVSVEYAVAAQHTEQGAAGAGVGGGGDGGGAGVAPLALAIGGVVALGVAGVFYAIAEHSYSQAAMLCGGTGRDLSNCMNVSDMTSMQAQQLWSNGVPFTWTADVLVGVGAVAVVAGVVLWLLPHGGSHADSHARAAWHVGAGPTPGGIAVGLTHAF